MEIALLIVEVLTVGCLAVVALVSIRSMKEMVQKNTYDTGAIVRDVVMELTGSVEQMRLAVVHTVDVAFESKKEPELPEATNQQDESDPYSLPDDHEWTDFDFPLAERPMVMGVGVGEGIVGPANDLNLTGEEYE